MKHFGGQSRKKQQDVKNEEATRTLADKLQADNKRTRDELTKQVANKLKDFQQVQSKEFHRMEENLMKILETKLENKVEAISMEVANQVALKLKDVLLH